MSHFHYVAFTQSGKKVQGAITATTTKEALDRLQAKGLFISKCVEKKKQKTRLNKETLLSFSLQLKELVQANIPLYEALVSLADEAQKESYHFILQSLADTLQQGGQLSSGMEQFPESFPTLYRSMVRAGETVGALDTMLERVVIWLTKQAKVEKELKQAMIYPSVLASFSLLVILLLLTFVVPSIEGMFEGKEVGGLTALVIGTSHFFVDDVYLWLPASLLSVFLFTLFSRSAKGALWLQKRLLHLPLLGRILQQKALARLTRTLSTLLAGGVPLLEALALSKQVLGHLALEDHLARVQENITIGSHLSKELARSPWIPDLLVRMVRVGEETGNLQGMLERCAWMYEEEVEKSVGQVLALAQPCILLLMGGIIGLIMLAVLLPLTQMANMM